MARLSVGSAHGRFQPLHNGHMEYLVAAKDRCDFLWVGITQFDIRSLTDGPAAPHRTLPQGNVLTYFERVQMISEAFAEQGLGSREFGIVPFPIEKPELLADFLPTDIPVFTTIYDEWNRYKVRVLEEAGYRVVVLWERKCKEYRGSEVRANIVAADDAWRGMVPRATERAVVAYNVRQRLIELRR